MDNKGNDPIAQDPIGMFLEAIKYEVKEGSKLELPVILVNLGSTSDTFELSLLGIPTTWVTLPAPSVIPLGPGESKRVVVVIGTPPSATGLAGEYTAKLRLVSQRHSDQSKESEIALIVMSAEEEKQVVVEVKPEPSPVIAQEWIVMEMENIQFSIAPGSGITIPILLINKGIEEESFSLKVDGLPANWISMTPPITRLTAGEQKDVNLVVRPPRSPHSKAGRYSFKVCVSSRTVIDKKVEMSCILTLAAFTEFKSQLTPVQFSTDETAGVTVKNQGNVQQGFTLTWQSEEDKLTFQRIQPIQTAEYQGQPAPSGTTEQQELITQPVVVKVPAGESKTVNFRARPKNLPILGGEVQYPFTTTVDTPDKQAQSLNGVLSTRALVPYWAVFILLGIFMAAMCVTIYLISRNQPGGVGGSQTAVYATTQAFGLTQTISANQTAAAIVGQTDTDGDGLADVNEPPIGTDPYKADTDGDGLLDGDEYQKGLNPLQVDTDQDKLNDGDEMRIGSNPLDPDTDKDGLMDGDEYPTCTSPINPDTDSDGIVDGKDLDPCDARNPAATKTADALRPTVTNTPSVTPVIPTSTPSPTSTQPPLPNTSTPTQAGPTYTPTPPRLPGLLVFDSNRDAGYPQLYMMTNLQQGSTSRLSNTSGADSQAALAPQGGRVAFTSGRDGNNEIYTMDTNGANLVNLTNNPADDQSPTWSPDGLWIAFTSNRDGNQEIYIMRTDGSELSNLSNNSANDREPFWGRTGGLFGNKEVIVYTSDRDGNQEIYVMDIDGQNQFNLTMNSANDYSPSINVAGGRVAFTSNRTGNQDIYIMDIDGSDLVNITNDAASDLNPSWSPDNLWIAYESNRDGNSDIYVIKADGSERYNITGNPADDRYPSWN
jgi:Tol biopolymer transport system component